MCACTCKATQRSTVAFRVGGKQVTGLGKSDKKELIVSKLESK